MNRLLATAAVVIAVVFGSIGSAAAQDQTITVKPANVEAADSAEFTVTGEGFTADPPFAIVPCAGITTPAEIADVDTEIDCDTSQVVLINDAAPWTATATFDVPAEGMCIVAGTLDGAEGGGACITVGAATDDGSVEAEAEAADEELALTGFGTG